MSKNNLIIKLNDNPIPNDCPICGQQTNPNIGAEIFLENTDKVVCFDCAEQRTPILASLLTFADLARIFHVAEDSFGKKWEAKNNTKTSPMNFYQKFGVEVRNEKQSS